MSHECPGYASTRGIALASTECKAFAARERAIGPMTMRLGWSISSAAVIVHRSVYLMVGGLAILYTDRYSTSQYRTPT